MKFIKNLAKNINYIYNLYVKKQKKRKKKYEKNYIKKGNCFNKLKIE